MKKVLIALFGIATAASTFGQGAIMISNYDNPPYSQIYWNPNPAFAPPGRANTAVQPSDGLLFQVYYGEGVITDFNLLTAGASFSLSTDPYLMAFDPGAGHGPGGYFDAFIQTLPQWNLGDTYTFAYQVSNGGLAIAGRSALWQENAAIGGPGPVPIGTSQSVGCMVSLVPEPSTSVLLGLNAALLVNRRFRVFIRSRKP